MYNEAPPRDPWNYVLTVRHHHEAFVELRPGLEAPPRRPRGITSLRWGTTMNSYTEVHGIKSNNEAPPWTLTKRVHGITSIWWHTTMSSLYRGHGITSYPNLIHALATNHEFPMHTNNMSFRMNNQSSNISHAKLTTNSLIPNP